MSYRRENGFVRAPLGVDAWIVISTCLVAGGWILSAIGQLNRIGYSAVLIIAVVRCWQMRPRATDLRFKRFRRPLPLLFLVLAGCALVGGVLYAPTNWDALAYRIPRVLNWLDAEKWHWISSTGPRVNNRATGFEWLMAPLILFTKSDRSIFLINLISFLLLPGLIFSVFTRIGVRPRVAWYWTWLLPGGYVFALQAGSIGNDGFAAVYALAAVDYALRGQASKRFKDFAFSLLAAGLLTGAKATNLPLLLPWLIAALPLIALWLRRKPGLSMATAPLAALISFMPTAVLNQIYSGDWTGLKMERATLINLTVENPLLGIAGQSASLLLQNVVPPFFPFAQWYNRHLAEFVPGLVLDPLAKSFHGLDIFRLSELPWEDGTCNVGFGLTFLLVAALVLALRHGLRFGSTALMGRWRQLAFCLAPFLAAAVVMARSGFACERLLAPFYPFMFCSMLLFVGHGRVIQARWWQRASIAVMALSVLVVVVTPPRPLFPARSFVQAAVKRWPDSLLLSRAQRVYSVYADRADALHEIRDALPAGINAIGFVSSIDDPEVSLWRPFLSRRRVIHVRPGEGLEKLRQNKIQYVIVNTQGLKVTRRTTLDRWCQEYRGEVVREWILPRKVSQEDEGWYLVRIADGPSGNGMMRAQVSEAAADRHE